MKIKMILIITLAFTSFQLFSQSSVSKLIDDYLKASVARQDVSLLLQKVFTCDDLEVYYSLIPYCADSVTSVRYEAYNLLDQTGRRVTNGDLQKKIVKTLIQGITDPDASVCNLILSRLTGYYKNAFDDESKYELSMLSKKKVLYPEKLIKLTGFVSVENVIPEYRKMLQEKTYAGNKMRWTLYLALARMGDLDAISYCVNKVRNLGVNDDVVYDIIPDLVYTHRKEAFDYLFDIILSDEKNCSSSNPDSNSKILCAFRISEQIAPCIENFPVEADASGGLKVKDYSAALTQIRSWILKNRGNYALKDNLF